MSESELLAKKITFHEIFACKRDNRLA